MICELGNNGRSKREYSPAHALRPVHTSDISRVRIARSYRVSHYKKVVQQPLTYNGRFNTKRATETRANDPCHADPNRAKHDLYRAERVYQVCTVLSTNNLRRGMVLAI